MQVHRPLAASGPGRYLISSRFWPKSAGKRCKCISSKRFVWSLLGKKLRVPRLAPRVSLGWLPELYVQPRLSSGPLPPLRAGPHDQFCNPGGLYHSVTRLLSPSVIKCKFISISICQRAKSINAVGIRLRQCVMMQNARATCLANSFLEPSTQPRFQRAVPGQERTCRVRGRREFQRGLELNNQLFHFLGLLAPWLCVSSSSSSSRYLTTLPRSSSKQTSRLSSGMKQSGTMCRITHPRTPRLAASMAAYSSLRVLSLVQ